MQIQPSGLAVDNSEITTELDGTAYLAEMADLDDDGWPEIYVYVSSAGSCCTAWNAARRAGYCSWTG